MSDRKCHICRGGPHGLETDKWRRHIVKTAYKIKLSIHLLFCKSLHYEDIAGVQSVKSVRQLYCIDRISAYKSVFEVVSFNLILI